MKKINIFICLVAILMWQPMPESKSQSSASPVIKSNNQPVSIIQDSSDDHTPSEAAMLDKIDSNYDSIINTIKVIAGKQSDDAPQRPVEQKPVHVPVIIRDTFYQHDTLTLISTKFIEGPSLKPEPTKSPKKRTFLRRLFNKK